MPLRNISQILQLMIIMVALTYQNNKLLENKHVNKLLRKTNAQSSTTRLFSTFWSRACFIRLLIAGGLFFLLHQFYGAIVLWQYPLSRSHNMNSERNFKQHFPQKNFVMPGVLPNSQKFYAKTENATFMCIHSGLVIGYDQVNDDFCDCDDFTDEPSTSACVNGKFFCTQSSRSNSVTSIPSTMVNDGICDCCDGSDEWKSILLPLHVRLPVALQENLGAYQTPCKNHCYM